MSNNEPIELISLSVKLSKHHCSKKLLLSGIQLDRKQSLDYGIKYRNRRQLFFWRSAITVNFKLYTLKSFI